MSFIESVASCFSNYITFSGRAPRSEYWWFVLFMLIANAVLSSVDSLVFNTNMIMMSGMKMPFWVGNMGGLFSLLVFLPS